MLRKFLQIRGRISEAVALGDIARAKGMAQIAQETGLGRESLYKALSPEGNPEFATVLKVVRALGLRLRATTSHARFCLVSLYPVVAMGLSRGQWSVVGRQMRMSGVLTRIDSKGGMRFAFPLRPSKLPTVVVNTREQ